MARKLTIKDMQNIAKSKGGKCLSDKYVDLTTKLRWRCGEGHEWDAIPGSVKNQDTWCPFCGGTRKLTIEEMKKIAKKRGGMCLSKKYVNSQSKLKWQCKEGHKWEATPNNIKSGHWCPICAGSKRLTIEDMQNTAKERGGKCLSKTYINCSTKLKWKCKKGHVWVALPSSIRAGSWCPICSGKTKLTIEEMQKIAEDRGGKCLSKKYVHSHTKLRWRCKEGHTWETRPANIKRGTWCPVCAHIKQAASQRATIEEMEKIAKERGGECLSKKYVNTVTKLRWRCREGHVWHAKPFGIKQGNWCPKCSYAKAGKARRLTIEDMQEIASSKGGECLSRKYVNTDTKLRWRCEKNHRWRATPNGIKSGHWCPKCTNMKIKKAKKLYFKKIKDIAKSKGGVCLSKEYVNKDTKLKLKCKEGHIWKTTPRSIKRGHWCPYCAGQHKTIEDMQRLAESKDGICLSKKYLGQKTKLQWKCKEGHRWEATPAYIKNQGAWCPICARERRSKKS